MLFLLCFSLIQWWYCLFWHCLKRFHPVYHKGFIGLWASKINSKKYSKKCSRGHCSKKCSKKYSIKCSSRHCSKKCSKKYSNQEKPIKIVLKKVLRKYFFFKRAQKSTQKSKFTQKSNSKKVIGEKLAQKSTQKRAQKSCFSKKCSKKLGFTQKSWNLKKKKKNASIIFFWLNSLK